MESLPPSGGRPSSGGAAGILATLVPTGFRQPHMIESMAQGGPSHASGQVQPGDLLLEVDGVDVRTLSLKDIQSKIIGRTGTQVTLTLQRGKRNFPHKVTLARSGKGEASVTTPRTADFAPTSPRGLSRDSDLTAKNVGSRGSGDPYADGNSPRRPQIENVLRGSQPNNSRYIEALSDRSARQSAPSTMSVPPIFGQRDLGDGGRFSNDDRETEGAQLNTREQAIDAKADYWREKFRSLEKVMNTKSRSPDGRSNATITKLESQVAFLEAELDQARRSSMTGGGTDDRVARLDGQIKLLKMQIENLEQARLREESRRIEAEDELRSMLKTGNGDDKLRDRLEKVQTMLDAERKERAAEEKRIAQLNSRLEEMRHIDSEKRLLDAKVEELQDALKTSRSEAAREARARKLAEETLEQMQSGHVQVDQLMAQRIKDLQQQLEDGRKDLRNSEDSLAKNEADLRQQRQQSSNQKKRLELQIQDLQDELDRKSIEASDLQAALGDRAPQAERSSELIDAQKKIRKLQMELESAQTTIDDDVREIRRLRELLHQSDASARLEDLHKELQAEQERRQHEVRLKIKEHEARNIAEDALATVKAEENTRSQRLEGMLRKLENDLEASSERSKKLEHERHELARALEHERESGEKIKEELTMQNKKLAVKVVNVGHDLAEVEDKYAKLQAELKDLERTSADTKARLEARIMHLEEYEAKSEAKLINTRRAMEQDEVLVQKVQRELDDWMEKCSQAEKRRDQLDFTLKRKEEELADALADAQAERALRQKLEIQNDSLKHQLMGVKEELRDSVQKLESKLAETASLLELEQVARRKAEDKVEELRASVRHLSLKSDGLEDKSSDIYERLKAAEAQRDRLQLEVDQLEQKLSAANKEMMTKMRAADEEVTKLRDQIQEGSHEISRERREKQALERQLADAKYEARKIDVLQHRVDDLQVSNHKETSAREESEAARSKAQKFAESVAEWDRALQEKNQRLEVRIEVLERELTTSQIKQAKAETLAKDAQDLISKDAKTITELRKEVQRLTDELDKLSVELQEHRSHYVTMREKFDSVQTLARRKTEELEVVQKRVEELTDILDRDKHLYSQIGDEEDRLRREVELLKRNLARADEISTDERKMRQELQRELDRLKGDYDKIGNHRLVDHRVASEDLEVMRDQMHSLSKERDEALFKATQYEVRYSDSSERQHVVSHVSHKSTARSGKDEEMILLLAENAQRDEELIGRLSVNAERDAHAILQLQAQAEQDEERLLHFAQQLKMAEEALEMANHTVALLHQSGGASLTASSELEKELYMAQDAVFELKQRSAQLEDDNLRLEKALQNAHTSQNGHAVVSSSKQAELETQLEHLIKLRTKGEEVLSSRLSHTQDDLKHAVERAERAEAHIRTQEQEITIMRG